MWVLLALCAAALPGPTTVGTQFDVLEYGAVGDGAADDSAAIGRALAAAAAAAPSTVVFPAGKRFLTKPINLTSSLTVEIYGTISFVAGNTSSWGLDFIRGVPCTHPQPGQAAWECPTNATFPPPGDKAACTGGYRCFNASSTAPNCQTYCHPVSGAPDAWRVIPSLPSWPGPGFRYQSLLMAAHARDITIRGNGTIDGGGPWWWELSNQSLHPWHEYGRPRFVEFYNCTNIEMAGITVTDSPFWTVHFYNSSNVWAHHLKIRNLIDGWAWGAPNADGIDCNSCKDTLIEHNDISVGDE